MEGGDGSTLPSSFLLLEAMFPLHLPRKANVLLLLPAHHPQTSP